MKVVRTTEVMQPFTDFSKIRPDVLDYASDRGTRFHSAAQRLCRKEWVPRVDDDIKGYVQSFRTFKRDMIKETVFTEQEFRCPVYDLVGHADWGGYLRDKPTYFTVLDWKTPISESPTWKGQLACYLHLARTKYNVKRIGTFQPNRDGNVGKVIWYENSAEAWESFLCALVALRYFKKGG